MRVYRSNPFYIDSTITLPTSAVNEDPNTTLVGADILVRLTTDNSPPGIYLAEFTRSARQVIIASETKTSLNCVVLVPPYVTLNLPNIGQFIYYSLTVTPINKYPISYKGVISLLPSIN